MTFLWLSSISNDDDSEGRKKFKSWTVLTLLIPPIMTFLYSHLIRTQLFRIVKPYRHIGSLPGVYGPQRTLGGGSIESTKITKVKYCTHLKLFIGIQGYTYCHFKGPVEIFLTFRCPRSKKGSRTLVTDILNSTYKLSSKWFESEIEMSDLVKRRRFVTRSFVYLPNVRWHWQTKTFQYNKSSIGNIRILDNIYTITETVSLRRVQQKYVF